MNDHDSDGCVRFLVATTGEVLLEIDRRDGRITSRGEPCAGPCDIDVALQAWLDEVRDEPTGEVSENAGDFAFGVPAKPDAIRLCDDGRIVACGKVGVGKLKSEEFDSDRNTYLRFARWLAGSKIDLADGRKWHVDMTSPMGAVRQEAYENANFAFSPSDHKDGVRFRFTSGRGKGGKGGDIVFMAKAKLAKV